MFEFTIKQESIRVGCGPPALVDFSDDTYPPQRDLLPEIHIPTPKGPATKDTYPPQRDQGPRYLNPFVDRMTHTCENIIFPQLLL